MKYKEYERLYKNDLGNSLKDIIDVDASIYIAVNLPKTIALITPDLLIGGEAPVITSVKNQERINEIIEESNYATNLYKATLTSTVKGDAAIKLILKDGKIRSQVIQPEHFFPKFDAFGEIVEADIAVEFKEANKSYLLKETHNINEIIREVYELNENKEMGNKIDIGSLSYTQRLATREANTIGRLTVIHLPNFQGLDGHFGESDFEGELELFKALNQRLSEIHFIISKHADPKIQVPKGLLDMAEDSYALTIGSSTFVHSEVDHKDLKMIEVGLNQPDIKYIHVDLAGLTQAFEELDRLIDLILMDTETSTALLTRQKDGSQAESGKALRFRLKNTLRKLARKKIYVEKAIREFFDIAQLLDPNTLKPEVVDIEFIDAITTDSEEQSETAIKLYSQGMISLKDALKTIYPNSTETVIDEMIVSLIDDIKKPVEELTLNI